MTSRMATLLLFYTVGAVIWLLALASHNAGNASAINALVGIPIGLVIWSPVLHLLTKGTR